MKKIQFSSLLALISAVGLSACGSGNNSVSPQGPGPIDGNWRLVSSSCAGQVIPLPVGAGDLMIRISNQTGSISIPEAPGCTGVASLSSTYSGSNQMSMKISAFTASPAGCASAANFSATEKTITFSYTINGNNLTLTSAGDPSCAGSSIMNLTK